MVGEKQKDLKYMLEVGREDAIVEDSDPTPFLSEMK